MELCEQADAVVDTAAGLRSVNKLLWSVIANQLPVAEQREVARAVGEQAIEDNQALFDEAAVLADLVDGLASSNKQLLQRLRLCANPKRQLLQEKIQRLLSKLGADNAAQPPVTGVLGPQDRHVISFVRTASMQSTPSRPSSAAWASRPSTAASSSSSRSGSYSQPPEAPEAALAALEQPIRADNIGTLKERLRRALCLEKEALLGDIEVLQSLLEEEVDVQGTAKAAPPSLEDLQACSERLQHACALQEQQQLQQFESSMPRCSTSAAAVPSSALARPPKLEQAGAASSSRILSCGASAERSIAASAPALTRKPVNSAQKPSSSTTVTGALSSLDQPSTSASSTGSLANKAQCSRPGKLRSMVQAAREPEQGSGSRQQGGSSRNMADVSLGIKGVAGCCGAGLGAKMATSSGGPHQTVGSRRSSSGQASMGPNLPAGASSRSSSSEGHGVVGDRSAAKLGLGSQPLASSKARAVLRTQ